MINYLLLLYGGKLLRLTTLQVINLEPGNFPLVFIANEIHEIFVSHTITGNSNHLVTDGAIGLFEQRERPACRSLVLFI
jgi:hypothetical protein